MKKFLYFVFKICFIKFVYMYVCECAYRFEQVEDKGKLLEVYLSVHHSVLSGIKCRSSWLTAD